MYPTISDFINNIFGTNIHLPIQTYGFFMAISLVIATWLLRIELKRREVIGEFSPLVEKTKKGAPAGIWELALILVVTFAVGYKLSGAFWNYTEFSENPQDYLMSLKGNIWGAIIIALLFTLYRWWKKRRERLEEPIWEEKIVHPYQLSGNILLLTAVSGLIGAKLFHNLENLEELIADPVGSLFSFMGLTFYGGLAGGFIAVVLYIRNKKIGFLQMSDATAPAIMAGYGIGRLGCMFSGDGCWGVVNNSPKPGWLTWLPDWMWAYNFPHNVVNEGIPIDNCSGKYCTVLDQPVFPTSLYDFFLCMIFLALLLFLARKIRIKGMLFAILLVIVGIQRYFMEQIRVNSKYDINGLHITQAEIISLTIIILGLTGVWFTWWWSRKEHPIVQSNSPSTEL